VAAGDQSPLISSQHAGRIQPTGWTPPDGDWCILIGSEDPDKEDDIEIGDKFGFSQDIDLTSVTLITFAMQFRNTTPATSVDFKVSFTVGGVEKWSEQIPAGAIRDYAQRTVNVYDQTGTKAMALVLEAVAP
jgi:hypothetical protein